MKIIIFSFRKKKNKIDKSLFCGELKSKNQHQYRSYNLRQYTFVIESFPQVSPSLLLLLVFYITHIYIQNKLINLFFVNIFSLNLFIFGIVTSSKYLKCFSLINDCSIVQIKRWWWAKTYTSKKERRESVIYWIRYFTILHVLEDKCMKRTNLNFQVNIDKFVLCYCNIFT